MKKHGELNNNTVVTTVMSNLGLYKAFDAAGNKSEKASVKATTKEGKTPETPTTPEVKPGTVQTGDATPFAVPFMMMFIAVAMFAGVSVIRVKKRK